MYSYTEPGPWEGMVLYFSSVSDTFVIMEHTLIESDKVRVIYEETRQMQTFSYRESVRGSKVMKSHVYPPHVQDNSNTPDEYWVNGANPTISLGDRHPLVVYDNLD